MAEVKDLQQLLDEKAAKQFEEHIASFFKFIIEHPVGKVLMNECKAQVIDGNSNVTLREALWCNKGSLVYREAEKHLLPKLKEGEARSFIKKVESLQKELNDLTESLNNPQ